MAAKKKKKKKASIRVSAFPVDTGLLSPSSTFATAKQSFDAGPGTSATLPQSLVPVDGSMKSAIRIRNPKGQPLEEYYKWQFIYALIHSGLYPSDHIGVELRFPKGSKTSAPLKLDSAIFDDPSWIDRYNEYWQHRRSSDLEWLNEHLLAVIEFKKNDKDVD